MRESEDRTFALFSLMKLQRKLKNNTKKLQILKNIYFVIELVRKILTILKLICYLLKVTTSKKIVGLKTSVILSSLAFLTL